MCQSRFGLTVFLIGVALFLGGCSSSEPPISLSLTPSTHQSLDQGLNLSVVLTAKVANDRSNQGVIWSLSGPGSLTSQVGFTVVYLPPTSPLSSSIQVQVTATAQGDPTESASVPITVNPYPTIPYQTLPVGTVGVPYSQPIQLSGGTSPFLWSVYNGATLTASSVGGSIPNGLALNPSTGTISGTPTSAGTWYFEGTVVDADGGAAVNGILSIEIQPSSSVRGTAIPLLNEPLVPTVVAPGGSGLTLKVSGTGFVSGCTVQFNGVPLATTFVDSEHLSAVVPASAVATSQTVSVKVVNPGSSGVTSNVLDFQVGSPETSVRFAAAPNSPFQVYSPSGLVAADFNEDGKVDLAITGAVRLYTMLSNGDGTFTAALGSPVSMPSPPYDDFGSPYASALVVGDFNHTGHAGLAVGLFQNEAAVIFPGNGTGTFSTTTASFANSPGSPLFAMAAADFNADGNLDLAVVNTFTGFSQVDLGYGSGAFNAAGQIPSGSGVAVGDFNSDGKLDMAVAGSSVISLGNGDGTFQPITVPALEIGYSPVAVITADLNGDGKLDLVTVDSSGNVVRILLGNGDGTFQMPTPIPVGHEPMALVVGDFNNDGKLDLAIANNGDGTVTLLLGSGDGNFTEAPGSPYVAGNSANALVAGDFNGDGKLDLAVANIFNGLGSLTILLQQ